MGFQNVSLLDSLLDMFNSSFNLIASIISFPFEAQKPSSQSATYMQASRGWNTPVVNSYPGIQPGFLKSAISGMFQLFITIICQYAACTHWNS